MATQTVRPNSTLVAATTVSPSGTTHGVTSDGAAYNSNATYARSAPIPGPGFRVALAAFTLPTGAFLKQHRVRAGAARNGGAGSDAVAAYVDAEHATFGTASGMINTVPASTSVQSITGTWRTVPTAANADGTTRQSFINSMNLFAAAGPRYYELFWDVVYVEQATVSLTIPDPTTTSSRLALSWVATLDADGGPQTHYRITVFDSLNAVVWQSGTIASSATTAFTDTLPNGEYTVFLSVAQTVNGTQFWSAQGTQGNVTIAVSPAEVLSVVATPSDVYGSISVEVTRDPAEEPWEYVQVERTDDGINFVPVRGGTIVNTYSDQTSFTVVDREAPQGLPVYYRARAIWFSDGQTAGSDLPRQSPVIGDWVVSTLVEWEITDEMCPDGVMRIHDPFDILVGVTVRFLEGGTPTTTTEPQQSVFQVLGREDLVGITDVRPSARTSMTFVTLTTNEAALMAYLLKQPVLVALPPAHWGWDDVRYFMPGRVQRRRPPVLGAQPVTEWVVEMVIVGTPADPLAGYLE